MSLFGKILAVLNVLALCAFLVFAAKDFQVRQAWTYAVFRWDLALEGFPVDTEEPDGRNRLRHLNLNEPLCAELVGSADIRTLEDFLRRRKEQVHERIDSNTIEGTRIQKTCEVLMQLASTASERERLQVLKFDKTPGLEDKLRTQLDDQLDALRKLPTGEKKDRDAKKFAIARALVSLVDVLPTTDEKTQRLTKPTEDIIYKQTLNALGYRLMTRALDNQALEVLAMATSAGILREKERGTFVYQHQHEVNRLIDREFQLQDLKDQLQINVDLASKKVLEANAQARMVEDKEKELEDLRKETARGKRDAKGKLERQGLEQLEQEQLRVFRLRMRLRDANKLNQEAERLIRELEAQKAQKGSD